MAKVARIGRVTVLRIAILTVSDRSSQGKREDLSGPALENAVIENGWRVEEKLIVPDEKMDIQAVLKGWTASK
jgi:molybdopterin adenylyltransferase